MQTQRFLETPDDDQFERFTISQVARLTGINAKALRYYESIGLFARVLSRLRSPFILTESILLETNLYLRVMFAYY